MKAGMRECKLAHEVSGFNMEFCYKAKALYLSRPELEPLHEGYP